MWKELHPLFWNNNILDVPSYNNKKEDRNWAQDGLKNGIKRKAMNLEKANNLSEKELIKNFHKGLYKEKHLS